MTVSDAVQLAGVLVTAAGLLLTAAGTVARRQLQSARAQGARIGRLERNAVLERVRRVQTERVLRSLDVYVPPWPLDDEPLDEDLVAQVLDSLTRTETR
jgi:hypothetical protein